MDEARGRRVPEEFVDPRNHTDHYQLLSVFGKVMALKTFKYKFIDFLHAISMDQDGIDDLLSHQQYVLDQILEMDVEYLLLIVTLEKVRETCIGLVLADFYDKGIES